MAATLPPGIGNDQQVNQANQFMREQPWYQALLKSWGQDPNNVHLSDWQQQELLNVARNHGIWISNDYQIDPSGNIADAGMSGWAKAALIGGGVLGAAFGIPAIAGLFGGAGAGAGASVGAALGPTTADTIAATAAASAAPAGIAAGLGGSTVGATSFLTSPLFSQLLGQGINAFSNLYGANQQSSAAQANAELQAATQKYIADLQAKASADALAAQQQSNAQALAFQKATSINAFQNNEASRLGNYNIWASQQGRLGALDALVGLSPRSVPAYVPGVAPDFSGIGGAASTTAGSNTGVNGSKGTSGAAPSISASNGDIGQQVAAYFKSRGVSDAETPYWVQKWQEWGWSDPGYFNQRLAQAEVFGGGGGTGSPVTSAGSVGAAINPATYLQPVNPRFLPTITTPNLAMPAVARTVGSYL